jgi:hypothetical protein
VCEIWGCFFVICHGNYRLILLLPIEKNTPQRILSPLIGFASTLNCLIDFSYP